MATAKAKLHQFYLGRDKKCVYETQLVTEGEGNFLQPGVKVGPDGLIQVLPEHTTPMFACTLHLPDGASVESGHFRRKREAEQDAALRGLHKLGIDYKPGPRISTPQQKNEELVNKISSAFTDQMVLSYLPLMEHFRASVRQKGPKYAQIPATALAVLDTKIRSLCKSIDCVADRDLHYATAMVCEAAAACPHLILSEDGLWIGQMTPFSDKLVTELLHEKEVENQLGNAQHLETIPAGLDSDSNIPEQFLKLENLAPKTSSLHQIEAVRIPACMEEEVVSILLNVAGNEYYQEVLAHELGVPDAGHVLPSRSIAKKSPSGIRMFWKLKKTLHALFENPSIVVKPMVSSLLLNLGTHLSAPHKDATMETLRYPEGLDVKNERASFLMGYTVHGDAILANIGSTWHSEGKCVYGDVTLNNYHRLMLSRTPQGAYKLSRQAVAVADLPSIYSSQSQWRGTNPRALLTEFCRHHCLLGPQFACSFPPKQARNPADGRSDATEENAALQKETSIDCTDEDRSDGKELQAPGAQAIQGPFQYTVTVQRPEGDKGKSDKIEFESEGFFRTRYDAIQSAALKAVHHYNTWCESGQQPHPPYLDRHDLSNFSELSSSTACHKCKCNKDMAGDEVGLNAPVDNFTMNLTLEQKGASDKGGFHVIAEEDNVGENPPCRSMVTVSYHVTVVGDATPFASTNGLEKTELENLLERQHEFEFQLGIGAVMASFEQCVRHARVGQTLCFRVPAQPIDLLLASNENIKYPTHNDRFMLEYMVKPIKCIRSAEERMRASQFRFSLSKQCIDYACLVVNAVDAKSLVDLGCGSGALLNSLLKEPNSLQWIMGVDISQKTLIHAAKMLHRTLKTQKPGHCCPWATLQRLSLYEGSITDMDPRLHSPDVATCIEVVEHFNREEVEKVGESVLGCLVPQVWIVTTPNMEYNPILRGLQWDPATNSCYKAVPSRDSEVQVPQDKEISTKQEVPNPSKFRTNDHRFECTRAEFREWASKIAARFDYAVRFAGVGGDKENGDVGDDTTGPGFAIQVAIFAHNSVLFPILRKEGELPAFLACDLSRITSEFTLPSGMCTHSDQPNMNYETSPKVIEDQFLFKELWRWAPLHPNEATACCDNMENVKISQADEEHITCS